MKVNVKKEVESVLDRIYLDGIGRKGQPPAIYGILIDSLKSLQNKNTHTLANSVSIAPFSWKRDQMYVLRATNHYMFSYEICIKDGEKECEVYEIAEDGKILYEFHQLTKQEKKQLYESIMRDIAKIVKKAIEQNDK